jgi:hypothetical protein
MASAQLPTVWDPLSATGSPPAKSDYAVAHIPTPATWFSGSHLFLYGGKDAFGAPLNGSWQFEIKAPGQSSSWQPLGSSNTPGPRFGHAMAYDPTRGGVVLFGGRGPNGVMNDTWLWNGLGWAPIPTIGATLVGRFDHEMVFDASTNNIVMFGGRDAFGNAIPAATATMTLNNTFNIWVQQAPMLAPPARWHHAMAYDSVRQRVVLFGGVDAFGMRNDLWQFNSTTGVWTQHTQAQSITGGGRAEATYDLARGRVVFFTAAGPSLLHEFDGTLARPWPGGTPPNATTGNSGFVYDSLTKSCVYYAGGAQSTTWRYRPSTFSNVAATGSAGCQTSLGQNLVLRAANGNEWQSATTALPRSVAVTNLVPSQPGLPVVGALQASLTTTSLPLGPCQVLVDNPISFPLQVVDQIGSNLTQTFGFPAGFVGTTVHYQFVMLDPVLGPVLSNRLSVTAGATF